MGEYNPILHIPRSEHNEVINPPRLPWWSQCEALLETQLCNAAILLSSGMDFFSGFLLLLF